MPAFSFSLRAPLNERHPAERTLLLSFLFLLVSSLPLPVSSHASSVAETFVDAKGTSASCVGIPNVVTKCVQLMTQAGIIREEDLGSTGLTLTNTGKDDGTVVKIAPGSAGDIAGLHIGDRITAVNGVPTQLTPGMIAEEMTFGERGQNVKLTVHRAGANLDVTLVRDPKSAPPGPTVKGFLYSLHPIVNWKGQFIPCLGAGPAGPAAVAYCESHFSGDGYIKVANYGSTGLKFDTASATSAKILFVDANSGAAKAGLQPGDEVVAVNGQPLQISLGQQVKEVLYGKAGAQFHLTVLSGGAERAVQLTLTPGPKSK
ncbi:MAG: PDZ domain-containing protein [Terracidiphilus sp.]|nr:PDZ domain-containing protein [Terracidiphilus sp.]